MGGSRDDAEVWEGSCWRSSWGPTGGATRGSGSTVGGGTRRSLRGIGTSSYRPSWEPFRYDEPITIVRIVAAGSVFKNRDLDMASTSFSPGVRRMMGRVGAKLPFEEGQRDLEELAGVAVSTKAVERVSEGIGS